MNDATVERLMMDAALGGLSEDVVELLMAYLERDPEKVREVQELQALIAKAREAIKEECPAQPDLQAMRPSQINQTMRWGGRIAAMAACLLIGFGIARMRPAPQVEVVVHEKPANAAAVAMNEARPASDGELWSASRIYRNAVEVNRNERPKVGTKRILQ
jgi:anti-sigma factor RsiW